MEGDLRRDHDQRFKTAIAELFKEFMELFFAIWASRLDCANVEWLMQEVFPDPPDGPRRVLDLVGKVATREAVPGEPDHQVALIHVEIESPDRTIAAKMASDYRRIRDEHGIPVLPIVLYLNVALEGVGIDVYEEKLWDFTPNRFSYFYVALKGLDAVQYVQGDNWLGVALAALMRMPKDKVAWVGAEALRRLSEAPITEYHRFLLAECVQAYLPMDADQRREYEKLIEAEPYSKVRAMNKTIYEHGLEQGFDKGSLQTHRSILQSQIENRFGPLPADATNRLNTMSLDQLKPLTTAVLNAKTLKDLGLLDD